MFNRLIIAVLLLIVPANASVFPFAFWKSKAGCIATGGTITTDGLYTVHSFTANANFVISSGTCDVEMLIVAGGGHGGNSSAGSFGGSGGGSGGVLPNSGTLIDTGLTVGTFAVVVGAKGIAHTVSGSSSFHSHTAIGGGAGNDQGTGDVCTNGGSGGGTGNSLTACTGTAGQGNTGGVGTNPGGGGGGPTSAGGANVGSTGGAGGNGFVSDIVKRGTNVTYGGGGGGGSGNPGSGGAGGGVGGAGGNSGVGGSAATGNGGGGGGGGPPGTTGGNNGSDGIVILRHL